MTLKHTQLKVRIERKEKKKKRKNEKQNSRLAGITCHNLSAEHKMIGTEAALLGTAVA